MTDYLLHTVFKLKTKEAEGKHCNARCQAVEGMPAFLRATRPYHDHALDRWKTGSCDTAWIQRIRGCCLAPKCEWISVVK